MHAGTCASIARAPSVRPTLELADIVRAHGTAYRHAHALTPEQSAVLGDIVRCRTALLGGHIYVCPCGYHGDPAYNSCRNRHCPKCQGAAARKWVEARVERVLPTHYFHVVFTLPSELRELAMRNRPIAFNLLFSAASATLLELAEDPKRLGARLGITMMLHTWARDLAFHPHVHAIVTGGGLSLDGEKWLALRDEYIFPVEVMAALFRGKFLAGLAKAHAKGELDLGPGPIDPEGFDRLLTRLYAKKWHLYAKRPFGGPEQVIKYLGRYTHRVGISNSRLESMDDQGRVTFRTKNGKKVSLTADAFLGRFVQHVLPKRFVKIRHYGLHSPTGVQQHLATARALLVAAHAKAPSTQPTTTLSDAQAALVVERPQKTCPLCGRVGLVRVELRATLSLAAPRGPP
jgi:hypothetical protein